MEHHFEVLYTQMKLYKLCRKVKKAKISLEIQVFKCHSLFSVVQSPFSEVQSPFFEVQSRWLEYVLRRVQEALRTQQLAASSCPAPCNLEVAASEVFWTR